MFLEIRLYSIQYGYVSHLNMHMIVIGKGNSISVPWDAIYGTSKTPLLLKGKKKTFIFYKIPVSITRYLIAQAVNQFTGCKLNRI